MKRVRRHIAIVIVSMILVALFGVFVPTDYDSLKFSVGSAYGSLVFFAAALCYGAVMRFRASPIGVSDYRRRDFGIWSALLALVHVVFALQHHVGGMVLFYFFAPPEMNSSAFLRLDAFGLGNWLGAGALLGLLVLLSISNDKSIRALGTSLWKRMQKGAYIIMCLILAHGAVVHLIAERQVILIIAFLLPFAAIATCRLILVFKP